MNFCRFFSEFGCFCWGSVTAVLACRFQNNSLLFIIFVWHFEKQSVTTWMSNNWSVANIERNVFVCMSNAAFHSVKPLFVSMKIGLSLEISSRENKCTWKTRGDREKIIHYYFTQQCKVSSWPTQNSAVTINIANKFKWNNHFNSFLIIFLLFFSSFVENVWLIKYYDST